MLIKLGVDSAVQKEKGAKSLPSEFDDKDEEEASDKLAPTIFCDLSAIKSEMISDYVSTSNDYKELHSKLDQTIKSQDSLKTNVEELRTLLQQSMKKIEGSLNLLVQKVCETAVPEEDDHGHFQDLLPLTKKEQLDELEQKIRDDMQYRRKLVRKLSTFGGIDETKTIRTVTKCLFTDLLLTEFSWQGTSVKKNFKQYRRIFGSILDAVRKRYPSYTDAEGSSFFKNYLKHAPYRLASQNPG